MAPDKVDDDKKLAASLLAVAVQKNEKNAPPPSRAVLLVSLWALLTAANVLGSSALAFLLVGHYHVTLPSWLGEGTELTAARAAAASASYRGALRCATAEAAAAALALLLPGSRRRSRGALAYAALAATTATHIMWVRVAFLLTAADNLRWSMWIVGVANMSFFAAGDVVCFLALSSAV